MPRSQSKTKGRKKGALLSGTISEDNDDCSSDITQLSMEDDVNSVYAESIANEAVTVDLTEDKIKESLENSTHKNAGIRLEALKILQSIFSSRYVPEHLLNWRLTAADAVERCLRKKSGDECRRAVNLGTLLAIQLGTDFDQSTTKFGSILKDWVSDGTLSHEFRAECANALGLYTYIAEEELEVITTALNLFEEIWTHTKSNGPALFSSCINSWALLLLRLPNRYIEIALAKNLSILTDLLENSQMEIRISSGEILCVLYELARQMPAYVEFDFAPPTYRRTLDLLDQMSRDSVKYHAKKDRRLQKASFRDIYAAIKENDAPEIKVKFGKEDLLLDSWSSKLCYNAFCGFLHGGINCHLQENTIMREIFGLGAPLLNPVTSKASKSERQRLNQSINKARSLMRDKQRDKRTATFV